jgi:hypothetical protein
VAVSARNASASVGMSPARGALSWKALGRSDGRRRCTPRDKAYAQARAIHVLRMRGHSQTATIDLIISTFYLPETAANVRHHHVRQEVSALVKRGAPHNRHCPVVASGNR